MTILREGDRRPEVKSAEQLLVHNAFHTRFYYGTIDEWFGPQTSHAVKRAKFRLGYAKASIKPVIGPQLIRYLKDPSKRPAKMKTRARLRKAAEEREELQDSMPYKAWDYMKAHLGDHETPPGSNHCPATVEWGHGDMAWCNVLVSLAYIHANSTAFDKRKQMYQYVPGIVEAARNGHHGLSIVQRPHHGDLVVWGHYEHITMFGGWTDGDRDWFVDIGGNEGGAGIVKRDVNSLGYVACFIHVEH